MASGIESANELHQPCCLASLAMPTTAACSASLAPYARHRASTTIHLTGPDCVSYRLTVALDTPTSLPDSSSVNPLRARSLRRIAPSWRRRVVALSDMRLPPRSRGSSARDPNQARQHGS